jgi:glycosyltransferase involved in cell wall biosynthesis
VPAPENPRVTVGLPVFNGENYLASALESLLDQTYTDFEVIVSDNASEDGTEAIARRFAAQDPRVRYERNERNLGANPNYNRTFALARGELFRWHAHDDVCGPKYLEQCVATLDADPTVSLVHTHTSYIDRRGEPLIELERGYLDPDGFIEMLSMDDHTTVMLADPAPDVRLDAVVSHMTVFFDIFGLARVRDVRRTLLLPNYYGADKVFLAEMALQGRLVRLADQSFFRRCHPSASTRATSLKSLAGWSDAGRTFDYYPALMMKGYLGAVRAADLSAAERRKCMVAVAKKLKTPYKLARGR